MAETRRPTAAIISIGDEILSGRTLDSNSNWLAQQLTDAGIDLKQVRQIGDEEPLIIEAIRALSPTHDYVFTTGGIGPTHDDITADAVAHAFGVEAVENTEAVALLEAYYPPGEVTDARRRMARIPEGAELIENPATAAPGFKIANVHVLAGVPSIMKSMVEGLKVGWVGGPKLQSRTIRTDLPESRMADGLRDLDAQYPDLSFGSYPQFTSGQPHVRIVVRGSDSAALDKAAQAVMQVMRDAGGSVEVE
ncbi:MAG: molybdopterin-binding protein [Alphaproteobacteria bacterium]